MIGATQFARMKDGVVLINTVRGSLVHARALIQALRSGKVAGAGLDVLPDEPLIREEAGLIEAFAAGRPQNVVAAAPVRRQGLHDDLQQEESEHGRTAG